MSQASHFDARNPRLTNPRRASKPSSALTTHSSLGQTKPAYLKNVESKIKDAVKQARLRAGSTNFMGPHNANV